jgi:hypothetical protein
MKKKALDLVEVAAGLTVFSTTLKLHGLEALGQVLDSVCGNILPRIRLVNMELGIRAENGEHESWAS